MVYQSKKKLPCLQTGQTLLGSVWLRRCKENGTIMQDSDQVVLHFDSLNNHHQK